MAKVMVSLPDELLAAVDEAAERAGDSRSRYVRDALRARLAAGAPSPARRREAIARLQATFACYPSDVSSVEVIRAERAR